MIIYRALFSNQQMKRIRRLLHRRRAATVIQKRARGMRGRRLAAEWKILHAYLSRHALQIQCCYRQRWARRRVRTIKIFSIQVLLNNICICNA
jgi:hypothetical protein